MVGFDPEKGNRFGTYARSYARKEMLAALADDPPALNLDFEQKVTTLFEDWKAPVCEQHYESSDEVEERDDDPPLDAGGHKILFREMERRRPYAKPKKRWPVTDPPRKQNERPPNPIAPTLWHPPIWALDQFRRKVRTRNFLKHPRTPLELANLGTYQAGYWTILKAFEKVAGEAMEGWADEDLDPLWSDQAEFLVASFLRSHVLKGKQFALPKSVLQERWQLGCERLGKKIRFEFNRGLGLFDRWGHRLPDYDALYSDDNVKIIRKQKRVPWLSLKPLAGIYYMQGTDTLEVFSWRRYRPKDTDEMATPFNEVLPVRLPDGARKELAKIAERRYQSACSLARQAIMALIEKAKKEEAKNAA